MNDLYEKSLTKLELDKVEAVMAINETLQLKGTLTPASAQTAERTSANAMMILFMSVLLFSGLEGHDRRC